MRSVWIVSLAVAALAVPVSASAVVNQTDYKNASKFCKALRSDMGTTAFKQTYGTNKNRSNAHGKCVSKNVKTVDEIQSAAVEQCKAAGTKPLGKCVSSARHQAEAAQQDAIVSAAKECRTERTSNPDAFREKYGTNHNKRNAFGKCVSSHVQEDEAEQQSHA
jgi:hypothetical protein